jgi:ribosomal protein L20A (L18A)
MKYTLTGELKIGSKMKQFTKHVEAKDEAEATERTLALFGSEHGTKRRFIKIEKIEKTKEIPKE